MRFCQPHWNALRGAIESRGLSHLIAANGRDAHARAVAELQGNAELSDYDPLMAAHWMIANRVLELGGLYLMTADYCPVCEAIKGHEKHMTREETEKYYIDGPADAVLQYCRENGLVAA